MKKILDFLYPPRCQLCGSDQGLHLSNQLCMACVADLRFNKAACQICAEPLGFESSESGFQSKICGQCTKSPPVFDSCWSAFVYAQPLEWMIQQLKFNAKLNIAPLLSRLMEEGLPPSLYKEMRPDVIIPMPLHNRRLKQRGFNQSHLIIKPIAKKINLPIDLNSCVRVRDTEHQTGKNAHQRTLNIKNAFEFINRNNYQHVLIFDDVVTTGSSISELSKTLKKEGVKRVDVWCLARAEKIN
ncbi:MAG: phosphoribosyltransferase [endosymbiont of Galathealinum brachiosum]|uniref:Phosphoribosyltransferase n=1 Tax=endosymbiont of Galathealinum brachiosum TaxID=2200906 RepID=A0A370DC97_9GAMM|nr:MAG: phosphoribosyltransferase [endosymbiont of Galathealinum brachiosum]